MFKAPESKVNLVFTLMRSGFSESSSLRFLELEIKTVCQFTQMEDNGIIT